MKNFTATCLACLLLTIPMACDLPENCGDPELIELNLEDSGKIIKMGLNDQISVTLNDCPDGYEWTNETDEDGILVAHGEPIVVCPPDPKPGDSCDATYFFDALKSGIGKIKFVRKWSWPSPDPQEPIATFEVKVIVKRK